MKIGVVFPQLEIGCDPLGLRDYAQAVRDLGFEHLVAYDHVLGADRKAHPTFQGPYDLQSSFHEPFVLFGYLAGVVPELELATGVLILPQRQAVLVAKQAAEVDVLTGGRFRCGVGLGWNAVEYEALGMPFGDRARRFEEQIQVMRLLWHQESLTFDGHFHRITGAGLNPLPTRRSIPLWIGGSAEVALRRAARIADGLFTLQPLDGDWAGTVGRLGEWVAEGGRDPEAFGLEARLNTADRGPDYWIEKVEEWRGLRASHLSVNTMKDGLHGPADHIRRLTEVARAIGLS